MKLLRNWCGSHVAYASRFSLIIIGFMFFIPFFVPTAQAECYTYDSLGRLTSVEYDNAGTAKRTYNLDEHGNRTTVQDVTSGGASCVAPNGASTNIATSAADSSAYDTEVETNTGGGGSNPPTNTPPITDNEVVSLLVHTTITVNPLEGDTDADGDVLALSGFALNSSLITAVQSGDSIILTAAGFAGSVSFSYTVSDGNGGTATGTIFVTVTAPILPPGGGNTYCENNPSLPECWGGDGGIIP